MSNAKVIQASREFVCIRLATYEDDAEAEYLKTIYLGRTGELENTVFVLLSPDGDKNLCRPGRGPHFAFRNPEAMAREMNEIAKKYKPTARKSGGPLLPEMKNVRLGINVSSCDGIPAVVCFAKQDRTLQTMKAQLAPVALSGDLAGMFVYSSTTDTKELADIKGFEPTKPGFLLITPDDYGLSGQVKQFVPADASTATLNKTLMSFANATDKVRKKHNQHVRQGKQTGQKWETEIPVTDPMSLRAMNRDRQ